MSKSLREVERLLALAREHSGAKFGFAGDVTAFRQELEELVAQTNCTNIAQQPAAKGRIQ